MVFILPVLYIFAVQGVESSTEYSIDYSTGETSTDSSSNLGDQIGKALPWLIFALIFAGVEFWARKTDARWPPQIQNVLAGVGLAPPPAGPPPGMPLRFNPPPNWPPAPAGWTPSPEWSPPADWPPPPPGWQLWVPGAPTGAAPPPTNQPPFVPPGQYPG